MICYECKDLFGDLKQVVERNVKAYKTDFKYDKEYIKKYFQAGCKNFVWMTREHGTQCGKEDEVFIKNSDSNLTTLYYLNGDPTIKSYLLEVANIEGEIASGKVYPIRNELLRDLILENEVEPWAVEIKLKDGEVRKVFYEEFNNNPRKCVEGLGEDFIKKYLSSEADKLKLGVALNELKKVKGKAERRNIEGLIGKKAITLVQKIVDANNTIKENNAGVKGRKYESISR